jgi:hypothetical protein
MNDCVGPILAQKDWVDLAQQMFFSFWGWARPGPSIWAGSNQVRPTI